MFNETRIKVYFHLGGKPVLITHSHPAEFYYNFPTQNPNSEFYKRWLSKLSSHDFEVHFMNGFY